MMPHVCTSALLYRKVEKGMRISTLQPCVLIRAADSQKKSGEEFSPDASSVTASYCTLLGVTKNSVAVRPVLSGSTKMPPKSMLLPLMLSWSPSGARIFDG